MKNALELNLNVTVIMIVGIGVMRMSVKKALAVAVLDSLDATAGNVYQNSLDVINSRTVKAMKTKATAILV